MHKAWISGDSGFWETSDNMMTDDGAFADCPVENKNNLSLVMLPNRHNIVDSEPYYHNLVSTLAFGGLV